MTAIIGVGIHKTIGFRVSHEDEVAGVDLTEHAETAYEFGGLGPSQFHPLRQHIQTAPSVRQSDRPALQPEEALEADLEAAELPVATSV
jgi:Amt family ammonium transporter